jgi:hypothetical protein
MGSTVIQMPLLGEGVDVWRPVSSQPLGGELFLIDLQPIPETEEWAFAPGDVVRCVDRNFVDGSVHPTAVAQVPEELETVQRWVELHDSVLKRLEHAPRAVEFHLIGYIHHWETRAGIQFGFGLMQPIFVNIGEASAPAFLEGAMEISDGSLLTKSASYANLIPLPLRTSGSVRLTLNLADGTNLEVSGVDCTVDTNGVARFVELLPADMYPETRPKQAVEADGGTSS